MLSVVGIFLETPTTWGPRHRDPVGRGTPAHLVIGSGYVQSSIRNRAHGHQVSARGRIPAAIVEANEQSLNSSVRKQRRR
jgi:hypothetical protein